MHPIASSPPPSTPPRARRALRTPRAAWMLALAVALSAIVAHPARAAWSHDPATNNVVSSATGNQWYPASVSDGAGGVIVAWSDDRSGSTDLYAQRLDFFGRPLWAAGGVTVCSATGSQDGAQLVSDGAGGALVVWRDTRAGNPDVYMQRVTTGGTMAWAANGVAVCNATGTQMNARVAADLDGGAWITWVDYRHDTNGDVFVAHFDRRGRAVFTANGLPVREDAVTQQDPVIVTESGLGAIVAWSDARSGTSLDVYAQHFTTAGATTWPTGGLPLCTSVGDQTASQITTDGKDGAVVTWMDRRGSNRDVYAQRINPEGVVAWTANGLAVCTATGDQWYPQIASDGASGAFVSWYDWRSGNADTYVQRVVSTGSVAWGTNGIQLTNHTADQTTTCLVPDGSGGVIVAWQDPYGLIGTDLYAQRLNSSGVVQWTANGALVTGAMGEQTVPTIVSDGNQGAIVTWMDQRGSDRDAYAQRVDRYGLLGAEPALASLKDVPNDQGGHLSVYWDASPLDAFPTYGVYDYAVYLRYPGEAAFSLYTTMYAAGLGGYSLVVPTTRDSSAASNVRTSVRIQARESGAARTWDCAADSGYSVDNLVPPTPGQFAGTWSGDGAALTWSPSAAPDLDHYALYRGDTPEFVPGGENLVATTTATGYVDAGAHPAYYKLAAVDAHDNASPCATLLPVGADAPSLATPRTLALSAPAPNPLRSTTTLRLALPRAAHVTLAVFDLQGRRVRLLAEGTRAAGEHAIGWDGRDDAGRVVGSALYIARLETEGRVITRRIAVVR